LIELQRPALSPDSADEAAAALVDVITDAQADAMPVLAQLNAAPDATPEAIGLALRVQEDLAAVAALVKEMQRVARGIRPGLP